MKVIKEGEEVQAKSIGKTFNQMIAENFPNLEKEMPIYRKPSGHQSDMTKTEPLHAYYS
jgi:hypothetical protein